MTRVLPVLIVVLAALDAFVHFDLAFLGPRAFSLNLFSALFILNVIGYVALIVAFLATQRSTISTRRIVTTVVAIYPIVALAAWLVLTKGQANPRNLAYISKPAEILLALAALAQLNQLRSDTSSPISARPA